MPVRMCKGCFLAFSLSLCLFVLGGCDLGAALMSGHVEKERPVPFFVLADFPKVFSGKTVVVLGDEASEAEKEAATSIAAYLEAHAPCEVTTVTASSEDLGASKISHNLIVIGTRRTNPFLEELESTTEVIEVGVEYPGENCGLLEITRSHWNRDNALLLVVGGDSKGVTAASEVLRYVDQLREPALVVDWNQRDDVKKALLLGLSLEQFELLEAEVRAQLYEHYPFIQDTSFEIRYELVCQFDSCVSLEAVLIDCYVSVRTPPLVVRAIVLGERVVVLKIEAIPGSS